MRTIPSAEAEAKQVQEGIEKAEDEVDDDLVDVITEIKPVEAAEADALAEEDRALAMEAEDEEADATKIEEAMPERQGETDEMRMEQDGDVRLQ